MTFIVESQDSHCRLSVIGLVVLGLLLLGASAAHSSVTASAEDPQLSGVARRVSSRGRLQVSELYLENRGVVVLELERFDVFTDDAVILAGDQPVEVPDTAYFRGSIVGTSGSRAVLGFKRGGLVDGLITSGDEVWRMSSEAKLSGFGAERMSILEESRDRAFDCQTGEAKVPEPSWLPSGAEESSSERLPTGSYSYSARVAVDTDWEFLNKFGGDVTAATDYVADLFAFSSTIYEAEVDTSLYISYLKWWPGGSGSDPWTQSSCSNALDEFRGYWRSNRGAIERTLVHLLSGKSTGCGIAASPSLCSDYSSYGLSGSLSGRFNPDSPMSSSGFWDILVVSHEIGHNFGSPHTHSYCNVSGNPEPVDACVPAAYGPACNGQSESLPIDCPGFQQRCGTIMSYCHLLEPGWSSNMALTFGAGHPYGDEPWRVPSRMNSYVAGLANSYPTCLSPIAVPIFLDDFESSNTSAWSSERQ